MLTGFVFVLGVAVGSFLNVVIMRTHHGTTFLRGRSHCPHCRRVLQWWEMIPVASFVFLRGRCRTCHHPLSWQYPIVEFLTGLGFVIVWWYFGPTAKAIIGWAIVATMILIGVYDARWAVIPDSFTISFAVAGLAFVVANPGDWLDHLYGLLVGGAFFAAQFIISKRRWVGSGDILLGLALGLFLGWRMLALALFISYLLGAMFAAGLIVTRRLRLTSSMAFGPWLIAGSFVAWLWGATLVDWYFNHALFY